MIFERTKTEGTAHNSYFIAAGHILDARHICVGHLEKRLDEVPLDRPIAVFCNVGKRASLGASILRHAGNTQVSSVPGSFRAWKAASFPLASG